MCHILFKCKLDRGDAISKTLISLSEKRMREDHSISKEALASLNNISFCGQCETSTSSSATAVEAGENRLHECKRCRCVLAVSSSLRSGITHRSLAASVPRPSDSDYSAFCKVLKGVAKPEQVLSGAFENDDEGIEEEECEEQDEKKKKNTASSMSEARSVGGGGSSSATQSVHVMLIRRLNRLKRLRKSLPFLQVAHSGERRFSLWYSTVCANMLTYWLQTPIYATKKTESIKVAQELLIDSAMTRVYIPSCQVEASRLESTMMRGCMLRRGASEGPSTAEEFEQESVLNKTPAVNIESVSCHRCLVAMHYVDLATRMLPSDEMETERDRVALSAFSACHPDLLCYKPLAEILTTKYASRLDRSTTDSLLMADIANTPFASTSEEQRVAYDGYTSQRKKKNRQDDVSSSSLSSEASSKEGGGGSSSLLSHFNAIAKALGPLGDDNLVQQQAVAVASKQLVIDQLVSKKQTDDTSARGFNSSRAIVNRIEVTEEEVAAATAATAASAAAEDVDEEPQEKQQATEAERIVAEIAKKSVETAQRMFQVAKSLGQDAIVASDTGKTKEPLAIAQIVVEQHAMLNDASNKLQKLANVRVVRNQDVLSLDRMAESQRLREESNATEKHSGQKRKLSEITQDPIDVDSEPEVEEKDADVQEPPRKSPKTAKDSSAGTSKAAAAALGSLETKQVVQKQKSQVPSFVSSLEGEQKKQKVAKPQLVVDFVAKDQSQKIDYDMIAEKLNTNERSLKNCKYSWYRGLAAKNGRSASLSKNEYELAVSSVVTKQIMKFVRSPKFLTAKEMEMSMRADALRTAITTAVSLSTGGGNVTVEDVRKVITHGQSNEFRIRCLIGLVMYKWLLKAVPEIMRDQSGKPVEVKESDLRIPISADTTILNFAHKKLFESSTGSISPMDPSKFGEYLCLGQLSYQHPMFLFVDIRQYGGIEWFIDRLRCTRDRSFADLTSVMFLIRSNKESRKRYYTNWIAPLEGYRKVLVSKDIFQITRPVDMSEWVEFADTRPGDASGSDKEPSQPLIAEAVPIAAAS